MAYVIAIDGGTESLRAAVFDQRGHCLESHAESYRTYYSKPGWAEQLPSDWWFACKKAVKQVVRKMGKARDEINTLCVDTTCCTLVLSDKDNKVLRPAILWMDVRSSKEALEISATRNECLCVNGGGETPVPAEWMLPKILWLRKNEAQTYNKATRIYDYQDYMNWMLTQRWVGSLSGMVGRWHYLPDRGGWQRQLYMQLGLEDLLGKCPNTILPPGQEIDKLTRQAAEELGLPKSARVIQGGADAYVGAYGLNVTKIGESALLTGSSHLQLTVIEKPCYKKGLFGSFRDILFPQQWVVDAGLASTGSILNWFKGNFSGGKTYEELDREASEIPIGSEGVTVLDHFQGNRSPYADSSSRGNINGLTLRHSPVHIYRAILESVGFAMRCIAESYGNQIQINKIKAAGGATKSKLWMQMHSDILGLPIEVAEFSDASLMGGAILGFFGAGCFSSISEAASAMVRIKELIEPNIENRIAYEKHYEKYRDLYHALRDIRMKEEENTGEPK